MVVFQVWILLLALVAATFSGWIAIRTSGLKGLPGCGAGKNCQALAASRWSRYAGIPVAWLGAGLYLLMAVLVLPTHRHDSPQSLELLRNGSITLALVAVASAAWFIFLQLAVLRKMCVYCNVVHIAGVAAGSMILVNCGTVPSSGALLAIIICLLLVSGQVFFAPKRYIVIRSISAEHAEFKPSSDGARSDASAPTESSSAQPTCQDSLPQLPEAPLSRRREVSLLRGRIQLQAADWPILGKADALNMLAVFFDYTCPICRKVHRTLHELIRANPERFALLALPIPQNPGYNPAFTKTMIGRAQACEFTSLAIGLWLASPRHFAEFDYYLVEEKSPPPLGLAMRRAADLAGCDIDPYRDDNRVIRMIGESVAAYRASGVEKIPNLILPRSSIPGELPAAPALTSLLLHELGQV